MFLLLSPVDFFGIGTRQSCCQLKWSGAQHHRTHKHLETVGNQISRDNQINSNKHGAKRLCTIPDKRLRTRFGMRIIKSVSDILVCQ